MWPYGQPCILLTHKSRFIRVRDRTANHVYYTLHIMYSYSYRRPKNIENSFTLDFDSELRFMGHILKGQKTVDWEMPGCRCLVCLCRHVQCLHDSKRLLPERALACYWSRCLAVDIDDDVAVYFGSTLPTCWECDIWKFISNFGA